MPASDPTGNAPELPIDALLPRLLATLGEHATAVLQAPPGAGKTTRVPLALLDADWRGERKILVLEPRRLAARAAARFMSKSVGEPVGTTVGFRTRVETKVSAQTRIEVVTESILVRMLQRDPELADCAAVLFDEFHERSLDAELGLALVRESQLALRPDLRVVVMSATLDAEPLTALLDDAPVLTSEGRSHPVDVEYRAPRREQRLPDTVAATVRHALAHQPGSLLVFLPGVGEIRAVHDRLQGTLDPHVDLQPLYGALEPAAQDAAIAPAAAGRRKVVLATSIAETSLTIEGIRVVVDAGLERRARFDAGSGMTRLVTTRVSRAAAEQRAGRLEPGVCYRLWSASEHKGLPAFTPPEILEADLAGLTHWRQVARLDLLPALENRLGYARKQRLDRLAPTRLKVPAGSGVRLDYGAEGGPVLAVKLPAVFGWRATPRIADGRVPVVLHLLSPAGRPLAVTADLESFWVNAYPEVARDMRGRYPKHPWPEDPLGAEATMRTKNRRGRSD